MIIYAKAILAIVLKSIITTMQIISKIRTLLTIIIMLSTAITAALIQIAIIKGDLHNPTTATNLQSWSNHR